MKKTPSVHAVFQHKPLPSVSAEELNWSDEESDYQIKPSLQAGSKNNNDGDCDVSSSSSSNQFKSPARLPDYQPSSMYRGAVDLHPVQGLLPREHESMASHYNVLANKLPMPYIPAHIMKVLGEDVVFLLWSEFVNIGASTDGIISLSDVSIVAECVQSKLGQRLPFEKVQLKGYEADDGISLLRFTDLLSSNHLLSSTNRRPGMVPIPLCCAMRACRRHETDRRAYQSDSTEIVHLDAKNHVFSVIYNRRRIELGGRFRMKHVPAILVETNIAHDEKLIPSLEWKLQGEKIVETFDELLEIINRIRTDAKFIEERESTDLYRLPDWLIAEFKPSEILLFRHHFSTIDIDKGGSIDVDELIELTVSLGNRITKEQAQALVDEYDIDGNGSIDFIEFMMLMFKIQRGTIDLEGNALAQSMIEAKAQIKIFEDIEEFQRNPPDGCWIKHYGELPIVMDVNIKGAINTPYEGGVFVLRVVFLEGYPYRCPDVKFLTRMFFINAITQLDGSGLLLHVKHIWNCNWTLYRLISHVSGLFLQPNFAYLPQELNKIVDFYVNNKRKENFDAYKRLRMVELFQELELQVRSRLLKEAEDAAAAARERKVVTESKRDTKKGLDDWSDDEIDGEEGAAMKGVDDPSAENDIAPPEFVVEVKIDQKDVEALFEQESKELATLETDSIYSSNLKIGVSIGSEGKDDIDVLYHSLSSIERMHLSTMIIYRHDYERFCEIARRYVLQFASNPPNEEDQFHHD